MDVEAHQTRRAGVVSAAPALIVLLETGKYIEPRTVGLGPRQVPIEVTCPGIPAAAAQRAAAGDMERCWPARHAAIEGDQGGIAWLRLEKRCVTVVFDRARTPAEDKATVTVDEREDAAGVELYADAFQRVAPVVPREPLGFGERRAVSAGKEVEKSAVFSDREGGHGRQL